MQLMMMVVHDTHNENNMEGVKMSLEQMLLLLLLPMRTDITYDANEKRDMRTGIEYQRSRRRSRGVHRVGEHKERKL